MEEEICQGGIWVTSQVLSGTLHHIFRDEDLVAEKVRSVRLSFLFFFAKNNNVDEDEDAISNKACCPLSIVTTRFDDILGRC